MRLQATDAKAVENAVQWALASDKVLELVGHGSKQAIGRPAQTDATLDLSALAGVTLYEPEELVLSAKAGTPIAEIEALLRTHRQQLAFEPPDYGMILGGQIGRGTIGGVLAANLSGPRRIKAGAARDHLLGCSAVSGRGEVFKSGGRVVKNVTGYDLCKLMAGSWGTLAAMTELTVKTLPAPETEATVLLHGLDAAEAGAAMAAALGSPGDVSAAAHLPAGVARRLPQTAAGGAVTALRLEGFAPSVAQRRRMLESLLGRTGEVTALEMPASSALWRAIRDVAPFASSRDGAERPLWRISTQPSRGGELAAAIARQADAELFYDWGGGLIWLTLDVRDDAGATLVRQSLGAIGGHATLIRAPVAARAACAPFEPDAPAIAALTSRVKESFDPKGVLNPGRMWAGV
jgi:glycolate oxidase FAD binding subunit